MPADRRVLLVPLRSNAHALLAGAPIARIRRRLKQAAISFDAVYLEDGALHISAGPDGSVSAPAPHEMSANFQSARHRAVARRSGFTISIGEQPAYGIPAETLQPLVQSQTTIQWVPTLRPFIPELTEASCDWVSMVNAPPAAQVKATAEKWSRIDQRNLTLTNTIRERFVRNVVVRNANRDLALGAHAGVSIMQDNLHRQVPQTRFEDREGWRATGFVIPILMPDVGSLDWDTIARIRGHKGMRTFRRLLHEIEIEAIDESRSGDVEAAVRHAMDRYWLKAVGSVESLGAIPRTAAFELSIGTMTGVMTSGLGGALAIGAGASLGAAVATTHATLSTIRSRRRKAWVSIYNELSNSVSTNYPSEN